VQGDFKIFNLKNLKIGFGVIESTSLEPALARKEEIKNEMFAVRGEKKLDLIFLSITDIINQKSKLLVI